MRARGRGVHALLAGVAFWAACGPQPWWENPDAIWITTFGGAGSDVGSGILELEDGRLILVGTMRSGFRPEALGNIYLAQTDVSGAFLWERVFDEGSSGKGLSILAGGGGDILIGVEESSPGRGNTDFALLRVDTAGEEIWKKTYQTPADEHLVGVFRRNSGGFLLFGNVMDGDNPIPGIGAAGNIGWDHRSSPSSSVRIRTVRLFGQGAMTTGTTPFSRMPNPHRMEEY